MIIQKNSKERPEYLQCQQADNYHQHIAPRKTMKKMKQEQQKQGNSYEAPTEFIRQSSIVNPHSYHNPYIENQFQTQKEQLLIKPKLLKSLNNWNQFSINNQNNNHLHIANNRHVQSVMTVYDPVQDQTKKLELNQPINQKIDSFNANYQKTSSVDGFNRRLGLFTDYVKQNNILNVYGPLLSNQRGIRRNPKLYAYETEQGEKVPRYQRLSSYVNTEAIDKFRKSRIFNFDTFRKTQSTYMKEYKSQQKIKKSQNNKVETQVNEIRNNINQKNTAISDGEDYLLYKDKEISNQNIIQKLNQQYPQHYYDVDKKNKVNYYKENKNYIDQFESKNYFMIKKNKQQIQRADNRGFIYYMDILDKHKEQEERKALKTDII